MDENIAIVYGSGASYASGYKIRIIEEKNGYFDKPTPPPTDQNFFNEIDDEFLKEEYYALWMFKNSFFGPNSSIGIEEVWTALDLNHKHIILNTYDWAKETNEYTNLIEKKRIEDKYPHSDWDRIKFKLTGDCGRDFRSLIYNVYSNYIEPDNRANHFKSLHDKISKAKSHRLLGYVTFNYDCYLENAIKTGFPYITINSDIQEMPKGCTPIIKLHGSLNWEENSSCTNVIFHSPSYEKDKQVRPDYLSDNDYIQPAIIPPTIFKQEINDDRRLMERLTRAILQQWKSAITILQEADKIIFVGYSFPTSDFHAKRIFQISNMIRRENNKPPVQILDCIGPKYNNKKDEKRKLLKNIFGDDAYIKAPIKGFDRLLKSKQLQEFLSA